ncbi:MAG TPA: sulfite exporter TauE/SafE family protein [Chloroflexota bacterium]|nr:sulfite exporter TauE/SafE family protein [Chloroflexota bacterium]
MRELVLNWYAALAGVYASVAVPLSALDDAIGIPAVSALLFGLLGALAPCQLSTGAGALAYLTQRAGDGASTRRDALAYVAGKVLVYSLLGGVAVALGREAIPVQGLALVRRLVGPAMLLMGLHLLRPLPIRLAVGRRVAEWAEARTAVGGGAFALGAGFAFAFCPTLFLLFFVLTVPLALTSPLGVTYPALFAVGTALPLLAVVTLVQAEVATPSAAAGRVRRVRRWLGPVTGTLLVLAGLHDTVVYWLL